MAVRRHISPVHIAVIALHLVAISSASPTTRILDGSDADSGVFPYAASVRLDNAHICGGTIIGQEFILTAAHCLIEDKEVVSSDRISVRVGSINQYAGGKVIHASQVIVHPDYGDSKLNDIAIIQLEQALELSDSIQVADIVSSLAEMPPESAQVSVAGWGELSTGAAPYRLQYIQLTVADEASCVDAFKDSDDSIVCLRHEEKQGICYGDAGNGGVWGGKVIAVSNMVIGACGSKYPSIFSSVGYFADWIKSVIN